MGCPTPRDSSTVTLGTTVTTPLQTLLLEIKLQCYLERMTCFSWSLAAAQRLLCWSCRCLQYSISLAIQRVLFAASMAGMYFLFYSLLLAPYKLLY